MTNKVSVIIPFYNSDKTLLQTLKSVLDQSLKEIEIICIDDGSTDSSSAIVRSLQQSDNRIRLEHQRNQGPGVARNLGIELAQGEYIAFMDADDKYPSDKVLERLYTCASLNKALICGGSISGAYTEDEKQCNFLKEEWIEYKDYQYNSFFFRFIYKRTFLEKKQIHFPSYRVYEDPVFFMRAFVTAEKFYAIPDIVYFYRGTHQSSQMNLSKTKDFFKGIIECLKMCDRHQLDQLYKKIFIQMDKEASYYAEKQLESADQELLGLMTKCSGMLNGEKLIGLADEYYVLPALQTIFRSGKKYIDFRNNKLVHCILKIFHR